MTDIPAFFYADLNRLFFANRFYHDFSRQTGPAMLLFSIDKPLIPSQDGMPACQSVLVPPGSPFHFQTKHSRVAHVYFDDSKFEYWRLKGSMKHQVLLPGGVEGSIAHAGIPFEPEVSEVIRNLWDRPMSKTAVLEGYDIWFKSCLRASLAPFEEVDPRIVRAVQRIHMTLTENVAVEEIACEVSLTPQRLNQLFNHYLGGPVRTYRLWRRLLLAMRLLGKKHSLSDAAILAGFADYAHCYRIYRIMGGTKPYQTLAMSQFDVA